MLGDYLILVGAPLNPAATQLLGLHRVCCESDKDVSTQPSGRACSPVVGATLRQGAYALYGACGAPGIQYLYALLGGKGGSGVWRAALAELKADYDKNFRYTGKV